MVNLDNWINNKTNKKTTMDDLPFLWRHNQISITDEQINTIINDIEKLYLTCLETHKNRNVDDKKDLNIFEIDFIVGLLTMLNDIDYLTDCIYDYFNNKDNVEYINIKKKQCKKANGLNSHCTAIQTIEVRFALK